VLGELPREVVERGSEIVEEISHDDREAQRKLKRRPYADDDLTPHLLLDEGIAVSLKEGVGLSIEALHVLVSPRELFANAVERVSHGGNDD
jgi:hypothetical protein